MERVLPRNFSENPIEQFNRWFAEAQACQAILQANAVCLSTTGVDGFPDGRMVLLKSVDARGFIFYTNLNSVKGRSLKAAPRAAMTFHWDPLQRQIRIQGTTERVSDAEADAYWATRPRISQLGAWASLQSQVLDRNQTLIRRLSEFETRFKRKPIPRPPHWTGIRILPRRMEFWRQRRGRLHERLLYQRQGTTWKTSRLYP